MIIEIIKNTPLWVFAVFAVLVYRGIVATRDRAVRIGPLLLLACVFLLLGGQGALSLAHGTLAPLSMWALAFVAALVAGIKSIRESMVYGTRAAPMQRGSVASLVLILTIFATRYSVAVVSAMHPDVVGGFGASMGLCALYGACSGAVIGRTVRVLMLSIGRPDMHGEGAAA